ncbi:MAG: hypothetical protein J0L67_08485 [Cytophagales bacterium]|nr:hypothetical protein [Cytophagales bacterium]
MKYLLKVIAAITLIVIGKYFIGDELRPELMGAGLIALFVLLPVDLAYDVIKNRGRLWLVVKCTWLGVRGEYIRFSMSYLYRIKVNDRYLLVKNSNWNHFQLVGGKYKRIGLTQKILNDFEAIDDLKMPTNGLKKDDLAVFVPAKNAIKFIDWFNSHSDREISHWREFYEELIEGKGKLLDQKIFPFVNYNFRKSVITPLKRTENWDCWEILQYDVLDLIPTVDQERMLEDLYKKGDTDYVKWADNSLIQSLGFDGRNSTTVYNIGPHTKWALNLRWSK